MYVPRDLWRRFETRELRHYQQRLWAQIAEIDDLILERTRAHPLAVKARVRRIGTRNALPWQIREAETKARAIAVMRLAARGWTNGRIGDKIGIHPTSVSRIVQRQLKAAKAEYIVTGHGLKPR